MNRNIVSLVLTLTFLIVTKVSAYVINEDTSDDIPKVILPTNIVRYDEDQIVSTFEYMVSRFTFEELCVRIGGLVDNDGNCINTNKDKKSKSTKTIPYEYRDIHWYVNQYPKTLTNFSKICYELTGGTINDIGVCVPKTTEPPRQVSSTITAITTKAPPASLTIKTTLPPLIPPTEIPSTEIPSVEITLTEIPLAEITSIKIQPTETEILSTEIISSEILSTEISSSIEISLTEIPQTSVPTIIAEKTPPHIESIVPKKGIPEKYRQWKFKQQQEP